MDALRAGGAGLLRGSLAHDDPRGPFATQVALAQVAAKGGKGVAGLRGRCAGPVVPAVAIESGRFVEGFKKKPGAAPHAKRDIADEFDDPRAEGPGGCSRLVAKFWRQQDGADGFVLGRPEFRGQLGPIP